MGRRVNPCLSVSLAVVVTTLLGACGQTDFKPQSQAAVRNDPTSLGVVDKKGDWVLPPIFKEIIYVKKLNAFWVKERVPADSGWKLVDHEGKSMHSQLPGDQIPLQQWPPYQALGFTSYSGALAVFNKEGAGLAAPDGKPLQPCVYHSMQDVGDGFLMGAPGREAPKNSTEVFVPQASLGNIYAIPPAPTLFDPEGKKVRTMAKGLAMPDGYFINDILVCMTYGRGNCAIDKNGSIVIPCMAPIPVSKAARKLQAGAASAFDSFYNLPVSGARPVKLIHISKKTRLPSEIEPIPVGDDLALAKTQDDTVGLINRKGEWVMPPDYNRLAYCDSDRFVCAKGRLTMDQQKALNAELFQPDIR